MRRALVLLGLTCLMPTVVFAQDDGVSVWMDVIDPHAVAYANLTAEASAAAATGETDRALAVLEQAQALRPDRTDAVYFGLRVLFNAGRNEVLLQRCASLEAEWSPADPDADAVVSFFAGLAHARMGQLPEAAASFESAVRYRHDLHDAPLYFANLGEVYAAMGDDARAVTFYQQALSAGSSYHLARLGLAASYARLGRDTEARREAVTVATEDPNGGFLDAPGVFFLQAGQRELYRVLLAEAVGDYAGAQTALAELRRFSTADPSLAAVVDRMSERLSHDTLQRWEVSVPGCVMSGFALSPDQARIAIACSDRVIEGPLPEAWRDSAGPIATWNLQRLDTPLLRDGYSIYDLTDLAYTADQATLRLLYRGGVVESVQVGVAAPAETIRYTAGNTPTAFVEGASRVVFSDTWGSSVIVADYDDLAQSNGTSWTTGLGYIYPYCVRASEDGSALTVFDGYNLTLGTGTNWAQMATHPYYDSGDCPFALDPVGDQVVIAQDGMVTLFDTAFQPAGLVRLPDNYGAGFDYYSIVVEYVAPELLGVGSYDRLWLMELPEAR